MPGGFHGALEGSGNRADIVVLLHTGAVQAESQALNSVLLELADGVVRQLGRGAGCDGNFEAQPVGVVDQRVNIFSAERIAAGEDQMRQRIAESNKLAEESLAFLGVELQGMCLRHSLSTAVLARQTAGLGHLPVNQHGISREIVSRAAHIWSSAGYNHDVPPSADDSERTPTSKFRLLLKGEKGCDYNHSGS